MSDAVTPTRKMTLDEFHQECPEYIPDCLNLMQSSFNDRGDPYEYEKVKDRFHGRLRRADELGPKTADDWKAHTMIAARRAVRERGKRLGIINSDGMPKTIRTDSMDIHAQKTRAAFDLGAARDRLLSSIPPSAARDTLKRLLDNAPTLLAEIADNPKNIHKAIGDSLGSTRRAQQRLKALREGPHTKALRDALRAFGLSIPAGDGGC